MLDDLPVEKDDLSRNINLPFDKIKIFQYRLLFHAFEEYQFFVSIDSCGKLL